MYRDFSPMVLRYLKAHGAREPEDVLGEVFVQVVRNLSGFEGDERDFRAWVFAIARSRLIDEWRHHERRPVECASNDVLATAAGPGGDAEDDALCRLTDTRVRAILEGLSCDQRDVLFLRLFAGLTVEQVAGVVGKRPGAVKALQARGLAAIQRALAKEAVTL
jgi:RNA polymerase sigma factor (sigma-70 family)